MNKMTLHIRASNCAIKEASGFTIGLYNMAAYGAYQNIILCMAHVWHMYGTCGTSQFNRIIGKEPPAPSH